MHHHKTLLLTTGLLLITGTHAATFNTIKVDDPVKPGSKCEVRKPVGSPGALITRFDQVDMLLIVSLWTCKDSGFIALMNDFKLSETEKTAIAAFLSKRYDKKEGLYERHSREAVRRRWQLLESVYKLRRKDRLFNNRLLRMHAFILDMLHYYPVANRYRKKALNDIKDMLAGKLAETTRLRYLYVAAAYERQFGNTASSDAYIEKLRKLAKTMSGKKNSAYADYMMKFIKDIKLIKPGGSLLPAQYRSQ